MRVDVSFEAVELRGSNLEREECWKAVRSGENVGLFPEIQHAPKGHVQEIAAPASRVKDANLGEFFHPGKQLVLQLRAKLVVYPAFDRVCFRCYFFGLTLHLLPAAR